MTGEYYLLDELWTDCEAHQCLSAELCDYVREMGEIDFADCLTWCWQVGRWPVGGRSIGFRWNIGRHWYSRAGRIDGRDAPHGLGWYFNFGNVREILTETFNTARLAFEFVWLQWLKLTLDQKRALLAMEAIAS